MADGNSDLGGRGAGGGGGRFRVCRVCGRAEGTVRFAPRRLICHTCKSKQRAPEKLHAPAEPALPPLETAQKAHVEQRQARDLRAEIGDSTPIIIQHRSSKPVVRVAFVPDSHHPNVHSKSWALMLRALMRWKPEVLVVLGDFADAETLSAHPPDEPGNRDFAEEVESVKTALTQLEQIGATTMVYIAGNHEFRLERYLARQAPALFKQLKGWPALLDLHERGWQWVPYRRSASLGKLHITHDTGSAGMNAHRTSAAVFGGSALIGHTHRMAYEVRGRFDSTPYLACMLGWLGDAAQAGKYMHEAKSAEWVHGFGVGLLEMGTGIVHLQPVPIVHGRCVIAGELVD